MHIPPTRQVLEEHWLQNERRPHLVSTAAITNADVGATLLDIASMWYAQQWVTDFPDASTLPPISPSHALTHAHTNKQTNKQTHRHTAMPWVSHVIYEE
jgi:hypothetical protein